jgi:hypothetical protein
MKLKTRRNGKDRLRVRRGTTSTRDTGLLTRTAKAIVYEAIRIGLPYTRACILAGMDKARPSKFRELGRDPENRKYYDFIQRCNRIEMDRELEALHVIRLAAKGGQSFEESKVKVGPRGTETTTITKILLPQWAAAAWYTERRDKEHFGKDAMEQLKAPEEVAEDIRKASLEIFNSVPIVDPEGGETNE